VEERRIVIIGTGFAGLGMAIRLKKAGIEDFVILEKDAEIGGVWRDNDYPGAACDIPSHLYSYSFERDFDWTRAFAPRDDIFRYVRHCADAYGLRPYIRTSTEVRAARFDDATGRWQVDCSDGTSIRCQVLVTGTGQLSRPSIPAIDGLESFQGESFHSARWNHDYPFEGKDVCVIGTGASAIQFVPPVAQRAERLTVFQRSAPYVIEKKDVAYGPVRRWLYRTFPLLVTLHRAYIYATLERVLPGFKNLPFLVFFLQWSFRWQLYRNIRDPELREKLRPDYPFGCKRILISNEWYPALARDNVQVETSAIARIDESGVVTADGTHHHADCIVFGTGFDTTHFLAPIQITGRGGRTLDDAWKNGAEAYLGITVSGFPNLFMLYGPNTNLGHNSIIYMLESQFEYILSALRTLDTVDGCLDVRPERQAAFNREIQEMMEGMVWQAGCRSWYVDANGRNTNNWPDFTFRYRRRTRELELADYEVLSPTASRPVAPLQPPAPAPA